MAERFAWRISDMSRPPYDIIPIDPDDHNDIRTVDSGGTTIIGVRALRVASGGFVSVVMASGAVRVLEFSSGETRVGCFRRVRVTGTTVTGDSSGSNIEGYV